MVFIVDHDVVGDFSSLEMCVNATEMLCLNFQHAVQLIMANKHLVVVRCLGLRE